MPKLLRCRSCNHRMEMPFDDAEEVRCPSCGSYISAFPEARPMQSRSSGSGTMKVILIILFGVVGLIVLVCCGGGYGIYHWMSAPTSFPEQVEDYSLARQKFKTNLVRMGPAPQPFGNLVVPQDAIEVEYTPAPLRFKAWLDRPKPNEGRKPAVLFLHGGFAFGEDDWEQAQPFRDAGFVVMIPRLRGENGLAGNYSMFYNEVDDALAAADVLAKQANVDPKRIYIAGHSVGGTIAMLSAMTSTRFRAAASFSGSPDQVKWIIGQQPNVIPFDQKDKREFQMRSPLAFARSFKCPTRLYYGDEEILFGPSTKKTAELAKAAGLDVEAVEVPGDHMESVEPAMIQCIAFFNKQK